MLKSLFNDFLEDLAKDAVKLINKFLVDLMDIALNCQNYISTKHLIKGLSLSKVNAVILKYAIALLILKFVQKGFSIYILQSDGDPDHDPIHILTGFCQAVAISVTFLGLYTPLVNIFETFTKAILTAIGSKGEIEAIKDQFLLTLFGNGITTVLLLIIFLIIIFLIYIQIIKNGAELMVLKFAIPLLSVDQACVDACLNAAPLPNSQLGTNLAKPGWNCYHDNFKDSNPNIEWKATLEQAEKVGMGTRQYVLKKV